MPSLEGLHREDLYRWVHCKIQSNRVKFQILFSFHWGWDFQLKMLPYNVGQDKNWLPALKVGSRWLTHHCPARVPVQESGYCRPIYKHGTCLSNVWLRQKQSWSGWWLQIWMLYYIYIYILPPCFGCSKIANIEVETNSHDHLLAWILIHSIHLPPSHVLKQLLHRSGHPTKDF